MHPHRAKPDTLSYLEGVFAPIVIYQLAGLP
jgi:hypothetical protein